MNKYWPTVLLCLMYIVANAYLPWLHDTRQQNWIIARSVPMPIGWNVKYLSDEVNWIIVALMVITYGRPQSRNKINKTSMRIFLMWCIFDAVAYIYNYKSFGYFAMYGWIPVAWLLMYFWKPKQAKWQWRQPHIKK